MSEWPRRGIVTSLIALATISGILATFAIWSARQLLETDAWTKTSGQLLEDDEIRGAVAAFLVTQLFDNVDVQGELARTLPPDLAPLAGPASGGLRQLANNFAPKLLEQPRVQQLWQDANAAAHQRLLKIINGDAAALTAEGDRVYLDLGVIVRQLGTELGVGSANRIPVGVARLDVLSAADLQAARDAVRFLERLTVLLIILTFGGFALAVYLAAGWRRIALRSVGLSLIAVGLMVLVARGIAGDYVVGALAATATVRPAAEAAWSIGTSLLRETAWSMVGYGAAVLAGAWLAGPGATATAARRSLAPLLAERRTMYPLLGALILLVVWWGPTEGTRRLVPMLVLVALLMTGAEVLRAEARREFPTETMARLSLRWETRLTTAKARLQRWGTDRQERPAAGAPPVGEHRLERLERLSDLRERGALTDEEYATEKQRVLAA